MRSLIFIPYDNEGISIIDPVTVSLILNVTRTMVIWLYNDALGYAKLLVQNDVSQRIIQTPLNDQAWGLVTVYEVATIIKA